VGGRRERWLNVLGPRSYIGELSWFDKQPRSATVKFIRSGAVLQIPIHLGRSPEQGLPQSVVPKLFELMSQRVRDLSERLQQDAGLRALHRIAKQLDLLADLVGARAEAKEVLINIRVTQEDVGDMVMATRETVNKCMKALKDEGILADEPRRIHILDRPRLQALAAA
jgi:CRP-like cAMP-binding protein